MKYFFAYFYYIYFSKAVNKLFATAHRFKSVRGCCVVLPEVPASAKVIIGRELTKVFEEIKIGTVEEVLDYFNNKSGGLVKGVFAVLTSN